MVNFHFKPGKRKKTACIFHKENREMNESNTQSHSSIAAAKLTFML